MSTITLDQQACRSCGGHEDPDRSHSLAPGRWLCRRCAGRMTDAQLTRMMREAMQEAMEEATREAMEEAR